MKPIELAKKIWDYAASIDPKTQKEPQYTRAPLYHYQGMLTMFAGIQAAKESGDPEWIADVNKYLAKYPHHFNDPEVFFKGSFDNYRVGSLGKGWAVMKGVHTEDPEIIREYAELTVNAPKTYDGLICAPNDHNKVWVDIVFAITPFM